MDFTVQRLCPANIDVALAIDDDASVLFDTVGLHIEMGPAHPFALEERARWTRAAQNGTAFVAVRPGGPALGLLVLGRVDALPYLDQLSVRRSAMRQGVGRRLLAFALEWAAREELWLTTYAHVPWNRRYYERADFTVMPEGQCPPGILEILAEQRRWLPAPDQRIAMVRRAR